MTVVSAGTYNISDARATVKAPQWLTDLLAEKPKLTLQRPVSVVEDTEEHTADAIRFLENAEPCVEHQNGDSQLFRVFCECRDRGVSQDKALELVAKFFNPRCQPPWNLEDESERTHFEAKARNAYLYAQNTPGAKTLEAATASAQADFTAMPDIRGASTGLVARDALDLVNDAALIEPPVLVAGLLHKGSTFLLGAASKSFKSWSLIDLAISVASGAPWWDLSCTQGRVLYADFELTPFFWRKRAMEIASARKLSLKNIHVLNCRGHDAGASLLAIESEAQTRTFDLIVLDPLYSFLAGRDENSAGDVGSVLRRLAMLAQSTGAALGISHHFSKGNQSGKDSIDRFSGSGVFARFPDALLTMTRHEQSDAFTVDPVVRNFAPITPFVVRWQHPLMVPDGSLDPTKLKKHAGAFKSKYSVAQIIELLGAESLSFGQIVRKTSDAFGMSKATMDRLLKKGLEDGDIEKLNLSYRAVSRSHGHETKP